MPRSSILPGEVGRLADARDAIAEAIERLILALGEEDRDIAAERLQGLVDGLLDVAPAFAPALLERRLLSLARALEELGCDRPDRDLIDHAVARDWLH